MDWNSVHGVEVLCQCWTGQSAEQAKGTIVVSAVINVAPEGNLSRYLQEIRKFPMLTPEEELDLSRRWRDNEDLEAAHKLVTSHLRLVAKIAMGYRGYGLPIEEVISEGNVGLMQTFAGVAVANITDVSFYQMTLLTLPGTAVDFYYQGQGVREVVVPGVPSTGGWDFFDATSYLLPNYTLVGFEVYGIGNSVGTNGITTTNPVQYDNLSITTNTATPEPGTLALFGCGLFGIIWIRRRRA